MKIPLSWLKEYISVKDSPLKIAKILTSAGIEVDSIETLGGGFNGVVVGQVIKAEKHPNADKLQVATVTDGKNEYQVVCGAPNCRAGLRTAFAPVGAVLKEDNGDDFVIKKAKLRGVESCGMLCSSRELKLGSEHEGIMELPENYAIGTPLADILSETIFEISLTPNLGHVASVLGVARELGAAIRLPVNLPSTSIQGNSNEKIEKFVKVTIEDKEGCPRYSCRLINNVKVGPSPEWLKKRLESAGLRSVNNIVDATNYVLMELGHPLHAFDFDRIKNGHIIIKSAAVTDKIKTLDGKDHELSKGQLIISDSSGPIAIAGVMGGENSEVHEGTTRVLLESAYFDPIRVRRSSKQTGIQSDASKRFERGTDPNGTLFSLDRAAELIQKVAGGEIIADFIDVKLHSFPEKALDCRISRVNQILGTALSTGEIEDVFHRLGLKHKYDGHNLYKVSIPTYRNDLGAEIDLIEEIARIYGYDNIPKTPVAYQSSLLPHNAIYSFEKKIHRLLLSEGLQEFLTCDLIGPSMLRVALNDEEIEEGAVTVLNPTSLEQSILRTSLLPGLLQVVKNNFDHQNPNVLGYEIGRIHFKEKNQYIEQSMCGVILTGSSRPYHFDPKPQLIDFYDLKGIVENVLSGLGIKDFRFENLNLKTFHPGRQASLFIGSLEIGSFGEIHPAIQRKLDVPQRIYFGEFNLHDLMKCIERPEKIQGLALYPGSERDWTLTVKESVSFNTLLENIQKVKSSLLEEVDLIDIYRSEKLGQDWKNVTLRFQYRDRTKTLAQETVDSEHAKITNEVKNALQECIRS